jgi:tetratricopeptide (TPR) repeat protein
MNRPPWSVAALISLGLAVEPAFAQMRPMRVLDDEITALPAARLAASGRSEIDRAVSAGDYERAERLLADAIARQPTSRELLTQIAGVFMLDRKPLNAAIALKKAEVLGPLDNPARLQLALAYIAMGRGDWARPELERLARDEPGNVIHPYWLARLDYDAGQYESAVGRLRGVVAASPAFARAHDNLGLCYEALHRPDEAIPHYREAVRLNRLDDDTTPSGWPALNLGILLRTRGELEEAERLFREAVAHDQRLAQGHYHLGALLEQNGRTEEAISALRKAAALDADYAQPHYALSRIYRRQGRAAEADAALTTFKRLHAASREPGR